MSAVGGIHGPIIQHGHSTGHTAVLDMQVAGADTAERNAHNGIARALQLGLRLVDQLELAVGYVGVGEQNKFIYNYLLLNCNHYIILANFQE